MNYHNRRHFTALLPCQCGREPMRVYCDSTDLYAVKCDCGKRTAGFTTIAGASRSWNNMNKNEPPPVCKTGDSLRQERLVRLSSPYINLTTLFRRNTYETR